MLRFLLLLISSTLAFAQSAFAEHAIYTSVGNQTIFGNGRVTRLVAKGFMVYDPDAQKAAAVAGFTLNGLKLFSVVPLQNYRVEHVNGPNGSTYTIIAKAESPGTQFKGVLLEAVYTRGKDASVAISASGERTLPRTFVSSGRSIVHNATSGITTAGEVTGSFKLDLNGSRASNLSESFDAAVIRLTNYFIAHGYTQFSAEPAE